MKTNPQGARHLSSSPQDTKARAHYSIPRFFSTDAKRSGLILRSIRLVACSLWLFCFVHVLIARSKTPDKQDRRCLFAIEETEVHAAQCLRAPFLSFPHLCLWHSGTSPGLQQNAILRRVLSHLQSLRKDNKRCGHFRKYFLIPSIILQVELMLPKSLETEILPAINGKSKKSRYFRVIMPLSALLEGEFFTEYIKKGNILMISEGQIGKDNTFCLCDGILKLSLDKESYERAGLVGKPSSNSTLDRTTPRYLVEINLRLPSMLHGKKGFERIKGAFTRVLNHSVSWLFYDLEAPSTKPPILLHHPEESELSYTTSNIGEVKTPDLTSLLQGSKTQPEALEGMVVEIYEWLTLAAIDSPRIQTSDKIDHYLSRYDVPSGDNAEQSHAAAVKLTWRGLLPCPWIAQLLSTCLSTARSSASNPWFSLTVYSFPQGARESTSSITTLRIPSSSLVEQDEFAQWEISKS